jgi:hypothetical protein
MALLDNLEAETRISSRWTRVSIDDALGSAARPLRCIACHGPMRAHKKAVTGQRAHFEHYNYHSGCPRGGGFDGTATPHPDALQ